MTEDFRLETGGPFYRFERATHLEPLRRKMLVAVGFTWVPLVLIAAAESLVGRPNPLLRDLSIHARLLIALPLYLVAERVLDRTARMVLEQLFAEGFVGPAQRPRVDAVVRGVIRWRDSAWPEIVILTLAVAAGLSTLIGWTAPAGFIHGVSESRQSAARAWYALVSMPISQFIFWRVLFRWALWVRILVTLARTPLQLVPWHADRRGGIRFLGLPTVAFTAVFLFAVGTTLCASWGTQILFGGAEIQAFRPLFLASIVVGAVLAFLPLLMFTPQLVAARYRGRRDLGGLVTAHDRAFAERWIGKDRGSVLGNPDVSSLVDISTAYRDNVEGMVPILFTVHDAITLLIFSQLPALPILLTWPPAHEALLRIVKLVAPG